MPPDTVSRLDWAGARERLDAIEAAIEGSGAQAQAAVEVLLAERARTLARPLPVDGARNAIDLIAFDLGDDRLAIPANLADGVIELGRLTLVPGLPQHYPGIVLHRGALYPVLDLGLLFRRAREAGMAAPCFGILVRQGGFALALAAHGVAGIERVTADSFAPATNAGTWQHLVDGVAPGGIIVLDVQRLLTDPRLIVHDKQ